ncbi:hypothetical protein BGY98DRAFT_1093805 [Russula aff. rugulosa BPL654]|nr:hypothetical protein BGY98DRAFT_1093805 [Russula aff. rugulosa BPL654]
MPPETPVLGHTHTFNFFCGCISIKIFYANIVVDGVENIPQTGRPCIICVNHSNALMDATILFTSIPLQKRNRLHFTAKSTLFGKKTFTSWLIEACGATPLQRRKDLAEGMANNDASMSQLTQTLEEGGAMCIFPEGVSRYHPSISPLKTGVARIVSAVLTRNRDNADFEISILTCSITYMHRKHFRSDVLVTFHPPFNFRPKNNPELLEPVNFDNIRLVTAQMHRQIATGTFDSPSWDFIRTAKMATSIYAPLGTAMSLGDYVRVTRTFLESFKEAHLPGSAPSRDLARQKVSGQLKDEDIVKLTEDLQAYQSELYQLRIRDDRIRRPLTRPMILYRMMLRFSWASILFFISLGGLALWLPVAITTFYAVHNLKKTGPAWDTWDDIARTKFHYGFGSGLCVYAAAIAFTLPYFPTTMVMVPVVMWMSLRWFEDAVSAARAFLALVRLLCINPETLSRLRATRSDLHRRVVHLAVDKIGLPTDPERHFVVCGEKDKGGVVGRWAKEMEYFSVLRRRKRHWNETLRLYEQQFDYPPEY